MECPHCGAELECIDYYGKTKYVDHYYLYPRSWIEKEGDIFKCPNSDYFEDLNEALEYKNNQDLSNIEISLEEIQCDSACHNGYFYTDSNGNLYEGYPC